MNLKENEVKLDHVPSYEELVEFYNAQQEKDPTSPAYKRVINRPKIHLFRTIIYLLITFSISAGVGIAVFFIFNNTLASFLSSGAFILIFLVIHIKHVLIWIIKFYQRVAPEKVRRRCRFEPSCSNYMIMAIEKYGFFKGLKKGINRLKRCKPPNGGYDEP